MPQLPPGLSVIIPAYKSGGMLPDLVQRLSLALDATGLAYEVILANDGSPDNTWSVIQQLAAEHPRVRGICLMRNYGQQNALLAGIRAASFDTIMTMDDDLQHPPEEIPKLLAKLSEGFDVVYGPPESEQHGLLRDLGSVITKIGLQSVMGAETARMVSAWRVFRTMLRDAFAGFNGPYVNLDVLLTWATSRFGAVRLRHDPRAAGESNYNLRKLIRHSLNMITGFSVLPLRFASLVGFVFTFFGVLVLGYVLTRYFISGSVVAGFPFLASIIALFSGAQLFALGIIGEYLARMHFRTMDKPSYTVRSTTEASSP